MKHSRFLFSLIVPVLVLILAACGSTSTTSTSSIPSTTATPTPTQTTSSAAAVIKTESVAVNGNNVTALTNDKGWTLYYFTPDTATTSNCATDACTTTWPPDTSKGTPTSSSSLSGKLDVQNNANGSQATYNGHDLYTYAPDGGPGQTKGEGVGGKWHVATNDLTEIAGGNANPNPAPTPTPSSGGYGY
jgi:predicted lipoprotein with Yx(FWY)xxD motif